ncbi:hypothetical protein [Paraflavitalea sp. CAU 1676]|uniref:hypothetical protein n=1 Tax=Paraflavitalea sp. CAU 1676 TaxID=3032598 RepID=UPI0023DACFEB|nr:hypothetical protein [Paraflavitalea sp. CAU 1676]MDF2190062.1 hypothetical protein [Paraflavitalea sp. CAU 1676]
MWRLIRKYWLSIKRTRPDVGYLTPPSLLYSDNLSRKKEDDDTFHWCLVGNIVEEHTWGEKKELKRGTKVFVAGAKVYCYPVAWGDGYEKIRVTGMHRKRKKYITIIIASKLITNWRLQQAYKPAVLKELKEWGGWSSSDYDKGRILSMLPHLRKRRN